MDYTTWSRSAVQWIINKCKAVFLPKTGGEMKGYVVFCDNASFGSSTPINVTDKNVTPGKYKRLDLNGRSGVITGLKALTAEGDYFYCADLNPVYTVTSNYASGVKTPTNVSGTALSELFNNTFSTNFALYTADLETTPWVLTIERNDGKNITATDVLSLWFFQHRLSETYGKVQSYKVEVLTQNNSTNVWEWTSVVERSNVNDVLNGMILPIWYYDGGHGVAKYGYIKGVRITVSKADSTGSYIEGFLPICAVQLRDHRPSMKPSEGLGALDIRGGDIFGPVTAKGPTAKFVGALQGNADTATNAAKVNDHTVESNVPANAKFTDTTYGVATSSADGLMTAADKAKLDGLQVSLDPTLPASGWTDGKQTVSAPGVTANNLVIVTVSRWGIECIAQGAGTLTFRANILPTVAVTAHVSVHNDL